MIGVLVMLRGLLRELIGWFTRLPALRRMLALSADGRQRLKFWLRSIVDVLLAMAGAVLVLSLWGLSLQDQLSWIGQAMRGVRIGQVTLSPIDLLLALGFFVLVLVLTRLGQRLLGSRGSRDVVLVWPDASVVHPDRFLHGLDATLAGQPGSGWRVVLCVAGHCVPSARHPGELSV